MHFQLNTENMHYSPERFLNWMTNILNVIIAISTDVLKILKSL